MSDVQTQISTHDEQGFEFDNLISFQETIAILHRYSKLLFLCVLGGVALSVIYIGVAAPRYTASTSILIDPRLQSALPDVTNYLGFKEKLVLDSQIEVIKSNKLLEKAAQRANLYENLSAPQANDFVSSIKNKIFGRKNNTNTEEQLELVKNARFHAFRRGLKVERVDQAFVLKISYQSGSPKTAAYRANLIAETYLEDELESFYEVSQRTNDWLKVRLDKLREELTTSEKAVEAYKEKNNILQQFNHISISDQQLSELNINLSKARTEAAHAKAQHESIDNILASGNTNIITSDTLKNGIITKLRNEHIALARRATEIGRKQGKNHQAYRNLSQQMGDIRAIIIDEYKRLSSGYHSAYKIAQSKTKALETELNKVRNTSIVNQRSQIELRELQRRAQSTRTLYTKMLDTFNEQTEQQSIPQVHARIINSAMEPSSPSWPKKNLILLAGLIFGTTLGIALILILKQLDRFIWKTEDLESATKRTCLGMLPRGELDDKKLLYDPSLLSTQKADNSIPFNLNTFKEITRSLDSQTSVTAEVMRNIQLSTQFDGVDNQGDRVISFVSANSGEGKSVTSCILAKHFALAGKKVALIDCDFRRPSLTRWFTPKAELGFYELASRLGTETREEVLSDLSSVCYKVDKQKLFFIPAKGRATSINNLNLIASGQMNALVGHLQKVFDVVIIDLPPIGHIVDARVIANVVDSFIFLTRWGKTDREIISRALERSPEVHDKMVGSLLTLVDSDRASQYGYYTYEDYSER